MYSGQEFRSCFLYSFFLLGLLLGGFRYDKLLKRVQTMTAFLVLAGAIILLAQKFKGL
jgi:hypothetical protein